MTFPLGSLRADGDGVASQPRDGARSPDYSAHRGHSPGLLRAQFRLLTGGVLFLLALLALATHTGTDAAFSTSGDGGAIANKAGALGAWFSDAVFFLFGYSAWWLIVVGARAWLGALAKLLRSESQAPAVAGAVVPAEAPAWLAAVGIGLLLASSAALEWTRLYQWEAGVAGGHAGGVLGYVLGSSSQKLLGFMGSGVFWIALLVAGIAMALRFSWLRVAERIGAMIDGLRTRRAERSEIAEDLRLGERAAREREEVAEVEHQL